MIHAAPGVAVVEAVVHGSAVRAADRAQDLLWAGRGAAQIEY